MKHIKVTTKVQPVRAEVSSIQDLLDQLVCQIKSDKDKCSS